LKSAVSLLAIVAVGLLVVHFARASSTTQFDYEYGRDVGYVHVMRVRDTSEGVVCYVAQPRLANAEAAAISCVREAK
jgi:hypothetical protein